MPYGTDGQPYPLIRPKRYPIRNQEHWPEPEEPMDARTFAMLRDFEQEKHVDSLSNYWKKALIYDLALELQGRLVAEEQATQHAFNVKQPDPTETLEAMPPAEVAMSREKDEHLDRCHADNLINAAFWDMQCGPIEDDEAAKESTL